MHFTQNGSILLNEENQIANCVPQILSAYQSQVPEEPLQLLLEVQRGNAAPQTLVWSADKIDALNLEKLIPGCLCRDGRGHSTKQLIATYLRMQLAQDDLPSGQYLSRSGWCLLKDKYQYIIGNNEKSRCITSSFESPPPYLINPEIEQLQFSSDPIIPSKDAVERLLQVIVNHTDIYLPVWSYTLFSTCRSFLSDSKMPTACILYLIATQGFGKTATAKALCQLFDDASGQMADVYDAGSTASAMERALMETRDRAVLFDDIYIGTNKAKQKERLANAAALLRFAANETSRTKTHGTKNISVSCSAGLVVTGEIPMEASSDVTRCIIVRIQQKLADSRDPVDLNVLRHIAATAMQGFLDWFGKHYDGFRSRIKSEMESQLSTVRNTANERVKKSLFELYWLLDRFFDYAQEIGAISTRAHNQFLKAAKQALTTVWNNICAELRRLENRPPTVRDAILYGIRQCAFPAFQHKGCICIRLKTLTPYLQKLYRRSDFSDAYVAAWLRKEDLLSMDSSGKSTKKINGKRYLCIPISRLQTKGTS